MLSRHHPRLCKSESDVVYVGVETIARAEQKRAAVRFALEEGEQSGTFEGDPFASVRAELDLQIR
jgi:hypothetical protein